MYIILEGEIVISINAKNKNGETEQKVVGRLTKGGSFGELALLFNQIRNASIRLEKASTFIVLRKEIFQKYIKYKTPPTADEILLFYDQNILQPYSLDLPKKIQILSKTEQSNYISNSLIIKQGHPINSLFFVKKGVVKVSRVIRFKVNPLTKQILAFDEGDPSEREIEEGLYKEISLEIDEIYEGSLMADYELYSQIGSTVSFVAYTPCEILSIQREDLIVLPPKMQEDFQNGIRPYPADYKLRRIYLEGLDWQKFRSRIVEGVCKENIVRKKLSSSVNFFSRSKLIQMPHTPQLATFNDSFLADTPDSDCVLNESTASVDELKEPPMLYKPHHNNINHLLREEKTSHKVPHNRFLNGIISEDLSDGDEDLGLGFSRGQKNLLTTKKSTPSLHHDSNHLNSSIKPSRHHFIGGNLKISSNRRQLGSGSIQTRKEVGYKQKPAAAAETSQSNNNNESNKFTLNFSNFDDDNDFLLNPPSPVKQKPRKESIFSVLMKTLAPAPVHQHAASKTPMVMKKQRYSQLRTTFSEAVMKKPDSKQAAFQFRPDNKFLSRVKEQQSQTFSLQGSHRLLKIPTQMMIDEPTMKQSKQLLPKITHKIQIISNQEDIICKIMKKEPTMTVSASSTNKDMMVASVRPPSIELI